jgi:uncharacterized protein (DUF169 family)
MGGAWAIGLREIPDSMKTGQFSFRLGKFESWASCKRTIDRIPHVESGTTYATLYAPLEITPFATAMHRSVPSGWSRYSH